MPSLAEMQLRIRRAVVDGDTAGIAPLLIGGRDPGQRLAIHQRHYRSSLVAAIRTKFPATAWLLGMPFLDEAAKQFVRQQPPAAPCIAEYGEEFPRFISAVHACPFFVHSQNLNGISARSQLRSTGLLLLSMRFRRSRLILSWTQASCCKQGSATCTHHGRLTT